MLVLTRRRDEVIMIGDDIEIMVVDVDHGQVRIGITAPPRLSVYRKEIYDKVKQEKERNHERTV